MIRVAVVGAGAAVEGLYLAALGSLEAAGSLRVAAVVDPDLARAHQLARHFKSARVFPALDSALDAELYDLAIIASPPALHAAQTVAVLERGCHVLCEKPMATTVADAESMVTASKAAGRLLAIGFPRRFMANFADAAGLVANGDLGQDLRFTYREGSAYNWPVSSGAAFDRALSGGGVLIDRGVHLLDQLEWIFGGTVTVNRAFDDGLRGGVETNSVLELSLPRARGVLQVSWEFPLSNGMLIRGSRGEVFITGDDTRCYRRKADGGEWMPVLATANWPADLRRRGRRSAPRDFRECVKLQLVAMLRALTYGEPLPVSGAQAVSVQQAVCNAYDQAEPLDFNWLPETERAAQCARHWNRGEVRV